MNYSFLTTTRLFRGIDENNMKHLLTCLKAREKHYAKNEIILYAGDPVHEVGLIQSGSVNIIVNFYWGDSNIFAHIEQGEIFAENYAALPGQELLCDVVAAEESDILFLNFKQLIESCQNNCDFHHRIINNLLQISARKSLNLSGRMIHTAPRSIRDRLLSYLSEQAMINGSSHFVIPFDRRQLADYLGVNRSALSNELSKMKSEGLINFKKNKFILKNF